MKRKITLTLDEYSQPDSDVYVTITKRTEELTQTMRMTLTEFMSLHQGLELKTRKVKPHTERPKPLSTKEIIKSVKKKAKRWSNEQFIYIIRIR